MNNDETVALVPEPETEEEKSIVDIAFMRAENKQHIQPEMEFMQPEDKR